MKKALYNNIPVYFNEETCEMEPRTKYKGLLGWFMLGMNDHFVQIMIFVDVYIFAVEYFKIEIYEED